MSDGMVLLTIGASIGALAAVVAVTRSYFARSHGEKRQRLI